MRLPAAITLALLVLPSCASTKLQSVWREPAFTGGPLRKVAVFVMAKDEALRTFAENQMAQKLSGSVTQAVAGHTLFPRLDADKEAVKARLIKDGFDGALVVRPVSIEKSLIYEPPQMYVSPGGRYYGTAHPYGSFGGYYGNAAYTGVSQPGRLETSTTVLLESVLYGLPEGKPVWTAASETCDPASTNDLVQGVAKALREDLQEEKVIETEKGRIQLRKLVE